MGRTIERAAAMAVLGATLAAVAVVLIYAVGSTLAIRFDTDPPKLVTGVYPAERDEASGLTFAWTGREMTVRLPGLDRRREWIMDVRVRAARQDASRNPALAFYADGTLILTHPTATDFETIHLAIPSRPERPRGAVVSLAASNTVVPGPNDARVLGVLVDEVTIRPTGLVLPPASAVAAGALGAAALSGAISLVLATPAAAGAAALLSVAQAALLTRGFAPYTNYPMAAARSAACIAVGLALLSAWRRRAAAPSRFEVQGSEPESAEGCVLAFSGAALFLKLLVLLHPDMPVGDAMFHAHRFQGVLGGNLYFTSIAPGTYTFPYPPGFYLLAAPFAGLVTRGTADMSLLRVLALTVDTIAGGLLYGAMRRSGNDGYAAAVAVVIYQLLPLDFRIFTVGNLTNAFAQSVSVFALVLFASHWQGRPAGWTVALLTFVLAVAFLSHTSTFPILFCTAMLVAIVFRWKGDGLLNAASNRILLAALVALGLSIALYYAHFSDTYRSEFARISAETGAAAPDAGGRGIGARLGSVPMYLQEYLGSAALLLTVVGAWALYARGARDRLTLATAAWALSCILFLAIGILTPVDMRYYLASIPAIAIAAAAGASALRARGGIAGVAGVLLLASIAWRGVVTWYGTF